MFTKLRTTAIIMAAPLVGICGYAVWKIGHIVDKIDVPNGDIPIVITTGLVAVVSATVGYLGGAMTRLTDDSSPPPNPLSKPLEDAIKALKDK